MHRQVRAAVVAGLLLSLLAPLTGHSRAAQNDSGLRAAVFSRAQPVRGMTVSAPRSGQSWASDAMVETMRRLRDLGVNWIAIHPYGGISADGTISAGRLGLEGDVPWITRPIREAHRLGLKIMIKPHLAYWHSTFPWRGAITFDTEEQWDRFFTTYEHWITQLARIAADADAFVVGTELDRTAHHAERWRGVIGAVRRETDAALTYAANWDSYRQVPFWGALDAIGVQAYFPLIAEGEAPEPATLRGAWEEIVTELTAFGRGHGRPVVLTELGYERVSTTALRPWEDGRRRRGAADRPTDPDGELIQTRCLEAALAAIEGSEAIAGAYLWKWFPGERARGSHRKSTPAMQAVIRRSWAAPADDGE